MFSTALRPLHRAARRRIFAITCLALLPLLAGAAHARGVPRLATLDHPGDGQSVTLDPSFVFIDDSDDWAARLGFGIEHQLGNGAGLAFEMAASFIDTTVENEAAISNLGLWGFWRGGAAGRTGFIGRAGLTVGTAARGGLGAVANYTTHLPVLQDLALAVPRAFALRLGGSMLHAAGSLFVRLDGGLDVFLANAGETRNPFLHLGGAVGVDARSVAFALELANLFTFDEDIYGEEVMHTLAFTASFPSPLYVSFILPLDEPWRGDRFTLAIGLTFPY